MNRGTLSSEVPNRWADTLDNHSFIRQNHGTLVGLGHTNSLIDDALGEHGRNQIYSSEGQVTNGSGLERNSRMSLDLGNMADSVEQALLVGQGENLGRHKQEWRRHFTQTGKELGNHLIRKTSNCRRRVPVDPRELRRHQRQQKHGRLVILLV